MIEKKYNIKKKDLIQSMFNPEKIDNHSKKNLEQSNRYKKNFNSIKNRESIQILDQTEKQ